jgi:excisionase family DNA binding protein
MKGQELGGTQMQQDETVLAVGIAEAARRLGLSARTVATLVLRHEIPSRKVGRRRIIPVAALVAFVRSEYKSGCVRPTEDLQVNSGSAG